MDEATAKTKWCPMVRLGENDSTDNRIAENGIINKGPGIGVAWNCCIGADCSLWVELPTREEAQNGYHAKSGRCGLVHP